MSEQHDTDTAGLEGTSDEAIQRVSTRVDLQEDGLLWMINTTIFHPRGLALARDGKDGELYIVGDDSEVWIFAEGLAEEKFMAFRALLERHLAKIPTRS